jgi:hypothetical protein
MFATGIPGPDYCIKVMFVGHIGLPHEFVKDSFHCLECEESWLLIVLKVE